LVLVEPGHDEVAMTEDVGRLDLRVEILAKRVEADVGGGGREAQVAEEGADRARVAAVVTGELDLLVADAADRLQHADEVLGEEAADGVELEAGAREHGGRGGGAAGCRPQRDEAEAAEGGAGGAEEGAAVHLRKGERENGREEEGQASAFPPFFRSPSLKKQAAPTPRGTPAGGSARRRGRSGWTSSRRRTGSAGRRGRRRCRGASPR